jgi:hypothetical protein
MEVMNPVKMRYACMFKLRFRERRQARPCSVVKIKNG